MNLPEIWQLPGRAGGNSQSPRGTGDPEANRHGDGPPDLHQGDEVRCGLGKLEIPAHEGGTAVCQPHLTGVQGVAWPRVQPSSALPPPEPPLPDLGFLPPPSSLSCSSARAVLSGAVVATRARSPPASSAVQPAACGVPWHIMPAPCPPARACGTPRREHTALARRGPGGSLPAPNTLCRQQCSCTLLYKPAPLPAPAQRPPRGAPAPWDTRGSRRNGQPHPAAPIAGRWGSTQEGTTNAIPRRGSRHAGGCSSWSITLLETKKQLKKWETALRGAI